MFQKKLYLTLFLPLLISFGCKAQAALSLNDTVQTKISKSHSPKKAAILSAILPGAGQAYNKKWWKIPIVYASIGTSGYFVVSNQKEYKKYKKAYIDKLNNPTGSGEFSGYTAESLYKKQDQLRNWRDISIIVTSAFYVLNIVDATVDAHFFHFDISDNLSLEIQPGLNFVKPSLGICLQF